MSIDTALTTFQACGCNYWYFHFIVTLWSQELGDLLKATLPVELVLNMASYSTAFSWAQQSDDGYS